MTDELSRDLVATGHWPASDKAITLGLMVPISEQAAFGATPRFDDIVEIGLAARDAGFDALWFADHFVLGHGGGDDPFRGVWECWTLMAAVAARVPDLQIGSLVACTGYRNPGVIAKMSEMIDEVSGGRFILGLGAGWHKPEYDQFGFPFDHRVSRFEDAISIIHPLLRQGRADYQGEFFQANEALNIPRGPRASGPPVLIGSNGPRMLNLIAQYADAWNTAWHRDTSKIPAQLEALDAACEAAGRDPKTLVRTAGLYFESGFGTDASEHGTSEDVETAAKLVNDFRDLGFSQAICQSFPVTDEGMQAFGRMIEMVHADEAG